MRIRTAIVAVLIGAATLFLFWPATKYDFVNLDDNIYVYENPHVIQGLNSGTLRWAFTSTEWGYWIPLSRLSYLLDASVFGKAARGYHLTNIVLHTLNAVLLFLLLARMTGRLWPAVLAALLFAVHPLRVESVVWITERKDVLSMFFGLLAVGCHVWRVPARGGASRRFTPRCAGPRPTFYSMAGVCLFMILSLMAKPLFITLPLLLLVLDWWPLGRIRFGATYVGRGFDTMHDVGAATPCGDGPTADLSPNGVRLLQNEEQKTIGRPQMSALSANLQLVLEKTPLFLVSLIFAAVTLITQHMDESIRSMDKVPLFFRVVQAPILYAAYLWKMIYPAGLSVIYPLLRETSLMTAGMALIGLVGITYAIFRLSKTTPALMAGWAWFLLAFLPMIGFVRAGAVEFADRFTYLPFIGVAVLVAWGLQDLTLYYRLNKAVVTAVAVMTLLALGFLTRQQMPIWRDGMTLFHRSLEISADNPIAYNNLGVAMARMGKYKEAIESFDTVLSANPNYFYAHANKGSLLRYLGRPSEGLPNLVRAVELKPGNAMYQFELGAAYFQLGQLEQGIQHLTKASNLDPNNQEFRRVLSNAWKQKMGRKVGPNDTDNRNR